MTGDPHVRFCEGLWLKRRGLLSFLRCSSELAFDDRSEEPSAGELTSFPELRLQAAQGRAPIAEVSRRLVQALSFGYQLVVPSG
jgi:hypothetical protein